MAALSSNWRYRLYECLPGALVWATFIGCFLLSWLKPLWAIYFIIGFDFFWFFRFCYLLLHLLLAYKRFYQEAKIDWQAKVAQLPGWQEIYHLVFLPTYKEPLEVIASSFASLVKADFPAKQMIVVLAGEGRDQENFSAIAKEITSRYSQCFFRLLVTVHPKDLSQEIAGKGANINYAGWEVKKVVDQLGLPYEKIIVSSFDVDTCVHPQYFSNLTYRYLTHPDPLHTSFQPVPLFHNNIWESPALNRVVANSTTFWLMTEQMRPERMFTFSSHAMPFKALVDVGFWQKDIVTEDSRIFIQCFLRYSGHYQVTPLYSSISMDTVYTGNLWTTLVAQYKQQRRWAWGSEHIPFMLWHFSRRPDIPLGKKIKHLFNISEGMYSWATAPIIILVMGRLPLWLASVQEKQTLLAQNAPYLLEAIMNLALVGLLITAVISTILLPPKPKRYPKAAILVMILQWVLFPITMIVFGAIPAIEAQTRLMLGKYLGFWVTPKMRKSPDA